MWQGVDNALQRFGLPAAHSCRPEILNELWEQIRLEEEDAGDQLLMRLL
ncbi:MAG: hypothetical protein ACO1SX_10820 [Actinomycetota bacterium]